MNKIGVARRSIVLVGAGLLVGLAAVLAVGPNPGRSLGPVSHVTSSEPASTAEYSGAEAGEKPPLAMPALPDKDDQPDAQAPDVEEAATRSEAARNEEQPKGPGLAAPLPSLPSQLQAAAAALAAKASPGHSVRVGVQAGHWKNAELPDELASLRGSTGATGAGWKEVDVNVDITQRVAALLGSYGVKVDLLPATVPVGYKADAFIAIHSDANPDGTFSGFKIARSTSSTQAKTDDALVTSLRDAYGPATGLQWQAKTITQNMLRYYAFNQRVQHSVSPTTPAAILEMGFLTNEGDRSLLLKKPDLLAQAISLGILNFLSR